MDFPPDIVRFIELHFAPEQCPEVLGMLASADLTTPRVMRAVLFLADGSLGMLGYYIDTAKRDVRDVLLHAEYITDISSDPMHVRDMGQPFESGGGHADRQLEHRPPISSPRVRSSKRHHEHLLGREFQLGTATYKVLLRQVNADVVLCHRRAPGSERIVKLPLAFVTERFAESIELIPVGIGG
jgi:hypothetical protein